jgi:single-strand DNA-binding protein
MPEKRGAESHRTSTAGCLANVALTGNVGADPESRTVQDGRPVARFRVAVNSGGTDADGIWQQHTDWYSITAFGPLATRALHRLARGARFYVHGRLQVRTWQGADGTRYFLDVVASELVPLDRLDRPTVGNEDDLADDDVGGLPF